MKQETGLTWTTNNLLLFGIISFVFGAMVGAISNKPDTNPAPTLSQLDTTLSKEICELKGGKFITAHIITLAYPISGDNPYCWKNGIDYSWQNGEWVNETKNVLEADISGTFFQGLKTPETRN